MVVELLKVVVGWRGESQVPNAKSKLRNSKFQRTRGRWVWAGWVVMGLDGKVGAAAARDVPRSGRGGPGGLSLVGFMVRLLDEA
jgi:hypothetical protein